MTTQSYAKADAGNLPQSRITTLARSLVLPPILSGSAIPSWNLMLHLIRSRVKAHNVSAVATSLSLNCSL